MKNKKCICTSKKKYSEPITFIILCSQKSNKRGYNNIPFTQIDDRFLIDLQLSTITANYPDAEVILISGFEHNRLVDHIHGSNFKNIRIAENKNYKMSSALDCWIFGLNLAAKNNTYIIHGDRAFSSSCISSSNISDTHILCHGSDKSNYNLGLLIEKDTMINISYGLPNMWSEMFFISRDDFDLTRNLINDYERQKLYNLESFMNKLANKIKIPVISVDSTDIRVLKELK